MNISKYPLEMPNKYHVTVDRFTLYTYIKQLVELQCHPPVLADSIQRNQTLTQIKQ